MPTPIAGSLGSLRLNTRTSQPRTTSNRSFQDQFRDGLRSGVDVTNSALGRITRGVPGGAMLSSSLSDAARNLGGPGGLASSSDLAKESVAGDHADSVETQMVEKNHTYLEQQMRISQITTEYSTKSNIIKALFDSLKTIGSNIR